jgi:O-antigen/teichoic acid export membrane protein
MFSDLGLKPSIVQSRRGDEPAFLNTAWVVQIFRGAALWLVALGIALLIGGLNWFGLFAHSSVYADPRLPSVIVILSVTVLISGLNSTKLFEASRHLAIGRVTIIELIAQD